MEPWLERLLEEHQQLSERLQKLSSFLDYPNRHQVQVSVDDKDLLIEQRAAMLLYHNTLLRRLAKAGYNV